MSQRPVLGIDLGTTYSCVAQLDDTGRATVLPNSDGEYTTPSVVYYEESGNVVVGKYAKKEVEHHPDSVVELIKRHMGEDGYKTRVAGKELYPQEVSAIILRFVVEDALSELGVDTPEGEMIADVVITVPAYFGNAERNATQDAGTMAGLNVLSIINEPTAAAIAYGMTSSGTGERAVMVYDLGGGTFDVTVIRVSDDAIRVVATGGDHSLGGADWDERIQDMLADEFQAQYPDAGDPRTDPESGSSFGVLAEEIKKALSKRETNTVTVVAHGERAKIELSRQGVIERTEDLVSRTIGFTRQVLDGAREKGVTKIDELLLVGGMSKSPIISQRLKEEFPDLPDPKLMDPDQIVAKGAALYAAHAVSEDTPGGRGADSGSTQAGLPGMPPKIINVSSKGYGIKTVTGPGDTVGHVQWMIEPNDEVPTSRTDTFKTVHQGQTEVQIEVFESTTDVLSDVVAEHILMVDGMLKGLVPNSPPGQPIQVTYRLGNDGRLEVVATSNGKELRLEAKISGSIPDEVLGAPLPQITR